MDCRSFRKNHVGFVDDTLSGLLSREMQIHLAACTVCAAYDARIRRALFLARNITPVDVSPAFASRLAARLEQERQRPAGIVPGLRGPGIGAFSAIAASLIAIGVVSINLLERATETSRVPTLPAVVALPTTQLDSTTAPALVASMSTGMPVWPALWIAEQAPLRFAALEVRHASFQATQP